MATGGIAMQGLSAAIVLTAIDKITDMVKDADALLDSQVGPVVERVIADIPSQPDSVKANYAASYDKVVGATGGTAVSGAAPGIDPLPAVIDGAVGTFFSNYLTVLDQLFPGLSAAGDDADAFIAAALASTTGVSYSELVDRTPGETAFLVARKQTFMQEREALDAAASAGHRFAPGATMDMIARLHGEGTQSALAALQQAHSARLEQERADKMRLIRSQIGTRMDRVKKVQQQTAEAFRLKMRARGMWVSDQNAVIDAANNKINLNAQFKARIDAARREAASRLHGSVVSALEIGDRSVDLGKLKMMNGQELVDMLGNMAGTLLNQIHASGSYRGSERDATDWDSILA